MKKIFFIIFINYLLTLTTNSISIDMNIIKNNLHKDSKFYSMNKGNYELEKLLIYNWSSFNINDHANNLKIIIHKYLNTELKTTGDAIGLKLSNDFYIRRIEYDAVNKIYYLYIDIHTCLYSGALLYKIFVNEYKQYNIYIYDLYELYDYFYNLYNDEQYTYITKYSDYISSNSLSDIFSENKNIIKEYEYPDTRNKETKVIKEIISSILRVLYKN